eukprot:XP_001693982.1 nucleolar protein [Chlamydomonas reinhardtii]
MGNASSGGSGWSRDPTAAGGDPSRPEYWRAQGDAHAQARNAAFAASKEAYRRGDHARAGQLSREGKQHAAQCDEANARAAALALAQHNTGRSLGELDLHGLRVKEAIAEVEKAIAAARASNPPQQRLVLIVGKGLHSADGVPKLKPAIEGLQLQALQKQRQPALAPALKKGKPSLLFDAQKAADVDLQTIYDLSTQGLEELVRLEPRFRPFRESLFSRASLDINPELQTAEFLSRLDESIGSFCLLLTNHFLAPPAFKALEYLIRRYKANERNVDALLTAALPYHATNEFVRLVQTLALGPPGSLRTYLSFYAVVLCEVLAVLRSVGEEALATLLPHLLAGLGPGAVQDYRAATLMAVAELCSRATLGRDFVKVLLNTMLKHTEIVSEHIRTALLVMAHMAVTQPHIRTLSDKTLKYLSALPNFVGELAALSQRPNIRLAPLLQLLCRSMAAALSAASATAKAEASVRTSCQKVLRKRKKRQKTDGAAKKAASTKKTAAGSDDDEDEEDEAGGTAETAEAAAAALAPEDRARFEFVRATFAAGGYSAPCGGTMMTLAAALAAPQAAVRRMALQQLDSDLAAPSGSKKGKAAAGGTAAAEAPEASEARAALTAAALERLRDDDLSVVTAALGLSCLKALPPAALLDALTPLSHKLGTYLLRANLARLPEAAAAASAAHVDGGSARQVLTHLAALRGGAAALQDLPSLVVTRSVGPGAARGGFLAAIYAAPSAEASTPVQLKVLALHVQAALVSAGAADVSSWLPTLLVALAAPEAAVRTAACDVLAPLAQLLSSGKASAGKLAEVAELLPAAVAATSSAASDALAAARLAAVSCITPALFATLPPVGNALLQWRSGITAAATLVPALQALLRRLLPVVGSIATTLRSSAEDEDEAADADQDQAASDAADGGKCVGFVLGDRWAAGRDLGHDTRGLHERVWMGGKRVVGSLPGLPPHRRLDLLLALMRALPQTPKKAGKKGAAAAPETPAGEAGAAPPPSVWLPELASQVALQVELPVRLGCCARVMQLALAESGRKAHTALPRVVVAFVTAQLKLKVALSAATAAHRRPEADPALETACRSLMTASLAQMQLLQPTSTSAPGTAAATTNSRAVLAASRGLYALFGALQGVMAPDAYLQALLTLAEHPADKVKRRALKLFTDKVRGVRGEIADQVELPHRAAALLAGVPAVLAATKDSHAAIRASALAAVAAFVRALGPKLRRPAALVAHSDAAIDAVEAAATRALVALTMKLSEARFKPMFLRLLEWASTVSVPEGSAEPSYLGRMVALYGAVNALTDRLRSVLVPYFRSEPRVRALALEVVAQLVDRLREEYLVLLPESLPFLSELLEDVDAGVASRVRQVVTQLEEISGEKLDEYLKIA